jgi:ubiquinone/menaquinone biosynthesis C-methylase UbiE
MPTIEENREHWTNYSWPRGGDEWSGFWGGTEFLWWGTLLPRIHAFVPTGTILEIAPGFGRVTTYLKDLCQQLILVDVTERCIAACQQRFSTCSHISYHVNDGTSLAMIRDHSIDFVISFDSLVHAEEPVIEAYLSQMSRILRPDGVGFLHHSNLGAIPPALRKAPLIRRKLNSWRAKSMTARAFQRSCEQAGLHCVSQELINQCTRYPLPHDCFSVFTQKNSVWARPYRVYQNLLFSHEARHLARLAQLYSENSQESEEEKVPQTPGPKSSQHMRA